MTKKITAALTLTTFFSANLFATDVYVGVQLGNVTNKDKATFTGNLSGDVEQDNSYSDLGVVIGMGNDGDWKGQLRLSKIGFSETIFDNTNKDAFEIGVDVIKEFEVYDNTYPFIKAGLGYTIMSLDNPSLSESSILGVELNIGAGLAYKVIDNISIYGGLDYVYRKWQDIQYYGSINATRSTTGSGIKYNAGVNFSF